MQASNFGGTFDQLFLWIFLWNFHKRCLSTSAIPWCKKVKNDQKPKSRGGGGVQLQDFLLVFKPASCQPVGCSKRWRVWWPYAFILSRLKLEWTDNIDIETISIMPRGHNRTTEQWNMWLMSWTRPRKCFSLYAILQLSWVRLNVLFFFSTNPSPALILREESSLWLSEWEKNHSANSVQFMTLGCPITKIVRFGGAEVQFRSVTRCLALDPNSSTHLFQGVRAALHVQLVRLTRSWNLHQEATTAYFRSRCSKDAESCFKCIYSQFCNVLHLSDKGDTFLQGMLVEWVVESACQKTENLEPKQLVLVFDAVYLTRALACIISTQRHRSMMAWKHPGKVRARTWGTKSPSRLAALRLSTK